MLIERSQVIVGLVVGLVLAIGTTYAVTLQAGALTRGDDIVLELADANRIEAGNPVQVAGVRVGQVMGVEIVDDLVHVTIRTSEDVPADSRARVSTTNALGARAITLEIGDDWDDLLGERDDPVIGLDRTEQLVDLPEVTDETVDFLAESDTESAARLFTSLADVTEDQHEEVGRLLDGLQRVSAVVDDNQDELEAFLADTGELLDVLNAADDDLLRTIDGVGEAVAALDARRDELVEFVHSTASFSETTGDLVVEERERIDAILEEVGELLALVDEHQIDLAHVFAYGGVSFEGFAGVGTSQGEDNPYWANIFTTGLGEIGVDALAGCGGLFDQVLDELLGPVDEECPEEEQSSLESGGGHGGDDDAPLPPPSSGEGSGVDQDADGPAPEESTADGGGSLERFLGSSLTGGES